MWAPACIPPAGILARLSRRRPISLADNLLQVERGTHPPAPPLLGQGTVMRLSNDLPGELSQLDVVQCAALSPLTLADARQTQRLAQTIVTERVLRHPLLVTPLSDRLAVLDGNLRLEAAIQLGIPDLLVQRIPVSAISDPLQLPALAVLGVGQEEILRVIEPSFTRGVPVTADTLNLYLAAGTRHSLPPGVPDEEVWAAFRRMVTALRSVADVVPLVACPDRGMLTFWPSGASAVLVPPVLTRDVLRKLAQDGVQLPWGSLQVPFPKRILGINLSLDILRAREPASEKGTFVRELVRLRLSERRIHYYDAPVYIVED